MNDETKIELLKIAAELTIATVNKSGTQYPGYEPRIQHPNIITLFGHCVTAVNEQYQQLATNTEQRPPD